MKKRNKKILLTTLIIIIVILVGLQQISPKLRRYFHRRQIEKENIETMALITEKDIITIDTREATESTEAEESPTSITRTTPILGELPEKAYLEAQFICQAPLETEANWTYHEESCEEAALLQAYLYETGQTTTKQEANEEILNMIDWQKENFSGHYDLYAEDMKKFAMGYYGLEDSQVKVTLNASIEDIKKEVASGHPVVVPITGEILNNPYYPYPGYHMLIVIGYTENKIITNDNGTRHGADFSYDTNTFKSAMDDAGGDILTLEL